jgi:hypothetical protein
VFGQQQAGPSSGLSSVPQHKLRLVVILVRQRMPCVVGINAQVRGVLLDPSCSGSGTVYSRMDHLLPSWQSKHSKHSAGIPQQQQLQQEVEGGEQEEGEAHRDGSNGQEASGSGDGAEASEKARITQLATFQVSRGMNRVLSMYGVWLGSKQCPWLSTDNGQQRQACGFAAGIACGVTLSE